MYRTVFSAALTLLIATTGIAQVCTPEVVSELTTPGELGSTALLGNTVFAAAGDEGIVAVDISDSLAPVLIGTTPTMGEANDIELEFFAQLLVVADGTAGVSVFTATENGAVSFVGSTGLSGEALSVAGADTSYLVGSSNGTLHTVELVDNAPTVQGSVDVGGPVLDIATAFQRAFCAIGDEGIAIVDISDRTSPALLATFNFEGSVSSLAKNNDLLFAAVADTGVVSTEVVGDTLVTLGSIDTPGVPHDLIFSRGRLYVAMPDVGIKVIDASLGRALLSLATTSLDGAAALSISGNLLYVTRGDDGLALVDVEDCSNAGVTPTTRYIPAGARAPGSNDTFWVTDVAVANMTNAVATFNVAYLPKDQANSNPLNVSAILEPGTQLIARDVFDELFDLARANGALRFVTSHPDVKVTSRTFNSGSDVGTFGQFIPALERASALTAGTPGALAQLQENAEFRTNIGLLNITPNEIEVEIRLFYGDGALAGSVQPTLLPFEMVQYNQIFGDSLVDSGYAIVRVLSADGEVLAYASVVDNGSGDPIYIPVEKLIAGSGFGG